MHISLELELHYLKNFQGFSRGMQMMMILDLLTGNVWFSCKKIILSKMVDIILGNLDTQGSYFWTMHGAKRAAIEEKNENQ